MSKLLVFLIDAMVSSDVDYMRTLPNFGWVLDGGAHVKVMQPVFPALTYCCHTSIVTGCYVNKHGIVQNEKLGRGAKVGVPWYCMKKDICRKTVLDYAKERGKTICSISWPVSGGANYDFNLPMIVPYGYIGYDSKKYLEGTSTQELLDRYLYKHGRFLNGPGRSLDLFTMAMALDILQDYDQPDVMLVKMCDLDSYRHSFGVYDESTKVQMKKHDEELGALLESLRRKGTLEDTNILVLGDHGHTDVSDILLMNVLLKQNGFITTDEEGNVVDFDAFCHSNGLSGLIEISRPDDKNLQKRVRDFLESLKTAPGIMLDYVMSSEEANEKLHYSGPFDFVVESSLAIAFGETCKGNEIWGSKCPGDHKIGVATHGGSPTRREGTTLFGRGPAFKHIEVEGPYSIVDEAPTIAKILGFSMDEYDIDGKAIDEILA